MQALYKCGRINFANIWGMHRWPLNLTKNNWSNLKISHVRSHPVRGLDQSSGQEGHRQQTGAAG